MVSRSQGVRKMEKRGEGGKDIETSSHIINKSQGCNIQSKGCGQ